jgi:NADH:ubiquinone oxidoreductase subunit 5 (subunit L)/multisubunit Na+/H+ antiporter MnhA subunit
MNFLFDWMSLLFVGFVYTISSLVILYSDYMFGDLNIIRFILLVLIFAVSIIFLIIGPVISILLVGGRQTCIEWWSSTLPTAVPMSAVPRTSGA